MYVTLKGYKALMYIMFCLVGVSHDTAAVLTNVKVSSRQYLNY